jgi:hypothetical protein
MKFVALLAVLVVVVVPETTGRGWTDLSSRHNRVIRELHALKNLLPSFVKGRIYLCT